MFVLGLYLGANRREQTIELMVAGIVGWSLLVLLWQLVKNARSPLVPLE